MTVKIEVSQKAAQMRLKRFQMNDGRKSDKRDYVLTRNTSTVEQNCCLRIKQCRKR